jgi:hypothetical protein
MRRVAWFTLVVVALSACMPPVAPPISAGPAAGAVAPGTPSPVPRPDVVRIELYEWSIGVEPPELPAGRYRVEIVNYGERVHSVMVAGPAVDFESRRLRKGGIQEVEIAFRAGEYLLWCPIGDHQDFGMLTSLTVWEGSPGQ